ncbi:hypothetical protein K466DRAFT_510969 [Polyporus arcularius HHB13444]|uniref:Fungal-type protein kinase domain-containing protein n=1 Tax=Polyporus arcularius HHB13444 TaxID=1314778 RepID=A0A5C3PVY9_9APHY|nr:hypothetical protein K466DRAFT_510969 [Polyporus arcularius HHB13444]
MSISTGSLRGHYILSGGSAFVKQGNPLVKASWDSELRGRIHVYHSGDVDEYINVLVPCSVPYARDEALNGHTVFADYKPRKGGEVESYPALISGFETLAAKLPAAKKLTFVNSHSKKMFFPFRAFRQQHHASEPDIAISFPGEPLDFADVVDHRWLKISMVAEVKPTESEDPFPTHKKGQANVDRIIQVARNARNLLLTHGFLVTYVVGIYGGVVRIARFDHTCAVVTPPFKLKDRPDLLQRFFWHFVHPRVGTTVVGCDPSVHRLTPHDINWVRSQLLLAGERDISKEMAEITKGRRVKVYNERTDEDEWFILYKVIDINARLFSRATTVWGALRYTGLIREDGSPVVPLKINKTSTTPSSSNPSLDPPVSRPMILKEAWRQVVRQSEAAFYERLERCIPPERWWGLPRRACGTDLGQREVRAWEEAGQYLGILGDQRQLRVSEPLPPVETEPTAEEPEPSSPTTAQVDTVAAEEPVAPKVPKPFPLPYPQHQTFSWAIANGAQFTFRERSHMRIVVEQVGRPLTDFKDTKELVRAMRDAIIGHKLAYELAGVLHRDVSVGNILIVDDSTSCEYTGFLHDFDYSSMGPIPGSTEEPSSSATATAGKGKVNDVNRKERTGTYYFMGYELLRGVAVIHGVQHDLESYFWVLLWVVLRHTTINLPANTCETVFQYGDDKKARDAKRTWVGEDDEREDEVQLVVIDNEPLTKLLFDFRALVRRSIIQWRTFRLTYDNVLKLFDTALNKEGWPANDRRECTAMKPPAVPSLVAPRYAIPAAEAPHSTGRVASAPLPTYHDRFLAAQRELFAIQPPRIPPMGYRHSVAGIVTYSEPKKRLLEEDIPEDGPVAGPPRSDGHVPTSPKRPRMETVRGDESDMDV